MKKGNCRKCGKYGYIEDHHILPVSVFGKNKHTSGLCPNCHTEYHDKLGNEGLKNENMEFHFERFFRWLYGLGVVALLAWLLW
jgi:hypothetical protein